MVSPTGSFGTTSGTWTGVSGSRGVSGSCEVLGSPGVGSPCAGT